MCARSGWRFGLTHQARGPDVNRMHHVNGMLRNRPAQGLWAVLDPFGECATKGGDTVGRWREESAKTAGA
jgi:hypothetical protein